VDIFTIASFEGSVAIAISGVLVGVRKELDLMGAFIVAMLTASGGGAMRDVLIGKTPAVLRDEISFLLVLAVMILVLAARLHKRPKVERSHVFFLSDAIGLAAFGITGALAGVEAGLSIFGVMVLAFITASGGGIIRDMIVNDMPNLLSSDFYGSIALLQGAAIYCLYAYGYGSDLTIACVFFSALSLRIFAYCKGWQLPRFKL